MAGKESWPERKGGRERNVAGIEGWSEKKGCRKGKVIGK